MGGGTSEEAAPFDSLGASDSTEGEDPFASLGDAPSVDDGFGAETESDPFSDLGGGDSGFGETTATDSFGDDDPFSSLGESASSSGDADFGDLGGGFDNTPAPSASDDSGFDDPFGDLGVGMEPPGLDDDSSAPSFDDFAPSIDDMPVSSMESDLGGDGGFEDDLMSLGKEDEPQEDLEAGLEDEDLAIIQRELIKYPPKLRRTIIDTIVNNRVPVRNQKELIELIKAQQKPEDVAIFLSSLLGEKVELSDSTGKFSPDGIPIIASKDAYTKEGAVRRREVIRKTVFSSAAAILLVFGGVALYKYVIVPFRAEAQYVLGLEKIEEYSKETDALEKRNFSQMRKTILSKARKSSRIT